MVPSALAAIFIAVVALTYFQMRVAEERDEISVEEAHLVHIQATVLTTDLRFIAYTLSFLRDQIQAHRLIEADRDRESFAHDLYSFMRYNDLFDQIRFIDVTGMERLRVDSEPDGPVVTPDQDLQFKGDTYYFRKTMALGNREIYISPLDLNKEHGKLERPLKPVIRFGLKVVRPDGRVAGVLIINHKAEDMLDRYRRVSSPAAGQSMLLNSKGYWLSHPDPKQAWGFMFSDGAARSMAKTEPAIWTRIQRSESGQFEDQGDIISFATVHPFAAFSALRYLSLAGQNNSAYWKVVSKFPVSSIKTAVAPIRNRVLLTALMTGFMVTLLITLVIRIRTNKAQLLEQVRALSQELMQARELERTEIARTLHDEFGQVLAAIQIQARLLDQECQHHDCGAALESIHRVEQFTERLQDTTRVVLQQLKPAHLEELGILEAVKDLCEEWQHSVGIKADVSVQGSALPIPDPANIHLFRIVQEGLTNIVRHSGATQARVSFTFKASQLILSIEDNGCGLNIQDVMIGNGLTSMRERIYLLGGRLEIFPVPKGGTRLVFSIPLSGLKKNP